MLPKKLPRKPSRSAFGLNSKGAGDCPLLFVLGESKSPLNFDEPGVKRGASAGRTLEKSFLFLPLPCGKGIKGIGFRHTPIQYSIKRREGQEYGG
jgi:hypothetical protein